MQKVVLRTQRLLLRALEESDIPSLVPLIGTRDVVVNTLRIPFPYTESDAREFLHQLQEKPVQSHFAMVEAETDLLCGGIGLTVELDHQRAELGYWLGVPFWGKGYATEAAQEVLRYGFEELKVNRIFAGVFGGNKASERVLQKIGMRHEGTLREHYCKWGRFLDNEMYAMLAADWRSRSQ